MREEKNKKFGFSLVELLVVIGIIATLTAILMPNYMGAREKARDAQRIQDLSTIKNSLRLYYNDHQVYPTGTGVTLGTGFESYMPAAAGLGYTYSYNMTKAGDGFLLCVGLESKNNQEAGVSQKKCGTDNSTNFPGGICGISAGTTSPAVYAVCAN